MKTNTILVVFALFASCSGNQALKYKKEADAFADRGDFYKAEVLYTKAIAKRPDFKEAYFNRGELRTKTNDYKGSILDFSKVLSLDSNDKLAWLKRGNIYHQGGEFQKALQDYNRSIALDDKSEIAFVSRGSLHYFLKDYQNAVNDYSKAITLSPKNTQYYLNRAQCYELLNRIDLNIADLETILKLDPSSSVSAHNLAFSYSNNQEFAKADSLFAPLYAQNPNDPFVLNNYGFVKFKMGDIKKGKELVAESLKIKPDNSYAYKNMAIILLAEKNKPMACEYMNMGVQKGFSKEFGPELEELIRKHCQ